MACHTSAAAGLSDTWETRALPMTSAQLLRDFRQSLLSLRELRLEAGYEEPDLKDDVGLRADARRFAGRLALAPDRDIAEMVLLADRGGAQAFWFLIAAHWESMELLLFPSAFELLPRPLPYEVLSHCFIDTLETEPLEAFDSPESFEGMELAGTFDEARGGYETLALSPRIGHGCAGAVWQYADEY
jgi:hypothetical protein